MFDQSRAITARRNGCRREEDHHGQLTNKSQANTYLQSIIRIYKFQKTK